MTVYLIFLALLIIPSLYRLILGPSLQDRLMALSLISVELTMLLCVLAVYFNQSIYLDIAIILALLSFAEITAFLKFQRRS